jgi:NADH-quinone oxidoreductase subunit G
METLMLTIHIDGKPYQIKDKGRNLLDVCVSLGFDLPYFCWHPAMHSVGACRQCAVKMFKDENDPKGWIAMACMVEATDGVRISISDPEAVAFRAQVIEWLMVNHPHDCPICDEGGECHLQDMTVMTGHTYRRTRNKKRTFENQNLGPFINHEMNRCIQCYRCVRFYRDYAGGRDFNVFGWHDDVYFGRHEDGVLENEFSGNLVEVCPTGVFTDKSLKKHYTRKWDLQTAPSICVNCGLGCNTIPGERYGMLRRIYARFNRDINGYFICDRGRYGYEFVNSPDRIRQPLVRDAAGVLRPASREEALASVVSMLTKDGMIGIGSPRASVEANYALRELVGPDHFYAGVREKEFGLLRLAAEILGSGNVRGASLKDAEQSDAVLILGEDPTNAAPMLDLALRQAAIRKPKETAAKLGIPEWHDVAVREVVQMDRGPFFIATTDQIKLDSEATASYRASPDDIARLGFAVAHELDPESPAPDSIGADAQALAKRIAQAMTAAKTPVVVSGVSLGNEAIVRAAANVARALAKTAPETRIVFVVPECNSIGLALMAERGLESAAKEVPGRSLIILENDLFRRTDAKTCSDILNAAKCVVAIDFISSRTTSSAHVVFPAATFAEQTGTLVNNEGRAQRFFQVFETTAPVQAGWRWLADLRSQMDGTHPWQSLDDVLKEIETRLPAFRGVASAAPLSDFRMLGKAVPRESQRHSGRTAISADVQIQEPKPASDQDAPMAFSMEGYAGQPPPELMSRTWAPGWNSVQAISKFEIERGSGLHQSAPGRLLIQPSLTTSRDFPNSVAGVQRESGTLWVVPAQHIFGSDELSVRSSGISELRATPYLGLNPSQAKTLKTDEGSVVRLQIDDVTVSCTVRIRPALPDGLATVPAGVGDFAGIALPATGRIVIT